MGRKDTIRLVIDTDVAGAASNKDCVYSTGQRCRDFLLAVLTTGLRVVLTPEIREEWSRHQSRFTRKWRVRMSARKQFFYVEPSSNRALLNRLQRLDATGVEMDAMNKDWRLVEAAIETDRTVASRESVVRELFVRACGQVAELRAIVWVNPDRPEEEPITWLEQGAPPDEHRKLGWKE